MSSLASKRLEYIDCIRGIAIFLLVYWHITYFCFHLGEEDFLCNWFIKFYLPLFYIVSGFVSQQQLSIQAALKKIQSRIVRILVPSVVSLCLFALFTKRDIGLGFIDSMKYGYWFTFSLFFIYLIFACSSTLPEHFKASKSAMSILYALISVLLIVINVIGQPVWSKPICQLFSLHQVTYYAPYFFVGCIIKIYQEPFLKFLSNYAVWTILFFGFILTLVFHFYMSSLINAICGSLLCFGITYHYKSIFSNKSLIGKTLILLGENSLEIYLVHYFLIYYINLSVASEWLQQHILIGVLTTGIISIVTIAITLTIVKLASYAYRSCIRQ